MARIHMLHVFLDSEIIEVEGNFPIPTVFEENMISQVSITLKLKLKLKLSDKIPLAFGVRNNCNTNGIK